MAGDQSDAQDNCTPPALTDSEQCEHVRFRRDLLARLTGDADVRFGQLMSRLPYGHPAETEEWKEFARRESVKFGKLLFERLVNIYWPRWDSSGHGPEIFGAWLETWRHEVFLEVAEAKDVWARGSLLLDIWYVHSCVPHVNGSLEALLQAAKLKALNASPTRVEIILRDTRAAVMGATAQPPPESNTPTTSQPATTMPSPEAIPVQVDLPLMKGDTAARRLDLLRDPDTGKLLDHVSVKAAATYSEVLPRRIRQLMTDGSIGYHGPKTHRRPLVADLMKRYPPA